MLRWWQFDIAIVDRSWRLRPLRRLIELCWMLLVPTVGVLVYEPITLVVDVVYGGDQLVLENCGT